MELATPPGPEFGVASPAPRAAAAVRAAAVAGGAGRAARHHSTAMISSEPKGALGTLSTAPRGHGIYTIGGSRATDPAQALPANRDSCRAVRPHGADAREEPAGHDRSGHQEHLLSQSR